MRRTWLSSQLQRKSLVIASALILLTPLVISSNSYASRNGIEEPTNTFTVGISFKFGKVDQLCSGVMLNPKLVATAGHCAYSTTGQPGTDYIFTSPGTPLDAAIDPRIVPPKVIKIFTDPNFSTLDADNVNDIAFLLLDKAVPSKSYLKYASRAELESLTDSSPIAGYGYGRVFETGASYSIYPRKYVMQWKTIDSATALSKTFNLTSTTATACKGDSGGPIVATLPSGKSVLVGALSGASNVIGGCGEVSPDGLYYIRFTLGYPFLPLISSIYDPAANPTPAPAAKKVTIRCKKGSTIKKVTALKPVCPKGYIRLK